MRFDPNFSSSVVDGITQSDAAFQTAEQQLSTGLRVNQASDDPAAAAAYTQNQTALAAVDQYTTNTSSALSMAQTASSALSSVVSLLTQAVTLGTAAATPVSESSEKSSLAAVAQGILASIVSAANTTFAGVAVFGGSSGSSTAFVSDSSSTTGYSYAGSSNANDAQIGTTLSVTTGLPGSTVFTQTGSSVLGAMSQLVSSVTSGSSTQIAAATNAVTNALNYVSQQQASIGDTITTLNTQDNYLGQEKVTLSAQQSSLVDISSATAAENVNNAQVQDSAVLAAAAKILPESLLNFLNK